MILEHAILSIREGAEAQFEAAFPEAVKELAASRGYISYQLHRSIEEPTRYSLFVRWRTLEDHIEGFRGSTAFVQWRAVIGPFFALAPIVEHYHLVVHSS